MDAESKTMLYKILNKKILNEFLFHLYEKDCAYLVYLAAKFERRWQLIAQEFAHIFGNRNGDALKCKYSRIKEYGKLNKYTDLIKKFNIDQKFEKLETQLNEKLVPLNSNTPNNNEFKLLN